jgi:gliding motility-associated-like protein
MQLRSTFNVLFAIALLILSKGMTTSAQIPTNPFEIQSILVDACGSPEGENEMFRFQVGPAPINSANLTINWPNNAFRGFCTDPVKLAALNATISGCGWLLSPPGGIIPAGQQVIVITSTNMNAAANSFANLGDTIYVLFQCAGNTNGHFANYSTGGATQIRTLTMTYTTLGYTDTASYYKNQLINQAGNVGAQDGGGANFDYAGHVSYFNNGCNAPFIAPAVHAGNDTSYAFCTGQPVVSLHGTKIGGVKATRWYGGNGTFSQPDSLNTTYTPSNSDVSPISLYLLAPMCNDSVFDTVRITIVPPVSSNQLVNICSGSTYTIGTHTYSVSGTYRDTLLTVGGCDSVVTTNLGFIIPTPGTLNLSGCESYTYKGVTYTNSTSIPDTLRGLQGCDSILLTVNINIKRSSTYAQTLIACPGQTVTVGSVVHSIAGTFTDTIVGGNAVGCDSIITTTLSYSSGSADAGTNTSICNGDSTQLQATGGLIYSWTPSATLSNPNIANPQAHPTTTTTYTVTSRTASGNEIVNGDFSAGNTGFSSSYIYTTPPNTNEGQYWVSTNAQVWNGGLSSCGDHTTGSGNMLIVNGATTANTSIYCQTVSVIPGEDYAFSTWLQTLTIGNPAQLQFSINGSLIGSVFNASNTLCNWEQFYATWNSGTNTTATICIVNQNTIASGNDFAIDDVSFSQLCNSTDSVTITVINPTTSTVNTSICTGTSYNYNGHSYNTAGSYIDTLVGASVTGCDSIVTTVLTIKPNPTGTINPSICQGTNFSYNGNSYNSAGTYTTTLTGAASNGCDSIVTINLTVKPNPTGTITPSICPGASFSYNGNTYNSAGTYTTTLAGAASNGCDSIVTINLSILPVPTGTINPSICPGATFTYNGNNYTTAGTYTTTLTGAASNGCDSVVTINLTLRPVPTGTINPYICQGGSFPYNGNTYTTTGTYTTTLTGAASNGCDSIVTINLTVDTVAHDTVRVPAGCDQVTYNGNTYNASTTLSTTLQNVRGCDSLTRVTIITVNNASIANLSPVICRGQSFTVGIKSYGTSGIYRDTLRNAAVTGCDSIVNTNLTVIIPSTLSPNFAGTCQVTYKGTVYTSSTNFVDTVKSIQTGCDSVYNSVSITVLPAKDTTINRGACIYTGSSYFVGGQNQTTQGVYRDTIRTVAGACDSIIYVTDLRVLTKQIIGTKTDSCDHVTFNGTVYSNDTILSRIVPSQYGCDSILYSDTLNILNSSGITITTSDTLPITAGDPVQLIITPAATYQNIVWSPNQSISGVNELSPVVYPTQTTLYSVVAQDANNCTVRASINVRVVQQEQPDFAMPTAFSPNNDGKNDIFKPKLRPGSDILEFRVYNRWGELIYDFNSNVSDGWDGTYKNVQQPIGVYAYYIVIKGASGKTTNMQGNLTLLR